MCTRERHLTHGLFEQDKSATAIIKELASGKLFADTSKLWTSLPDPDEEVPAVSTQRNDQREIRDLRKQLQVKNAEVLGAHQAISTAVAKCHAEYQQRIDTASEHHKRALTNETDKFLKSQQELDAVRKELKETTAENIRLRKQVRTQTSTIKELRKPVDSFSEILKKARRHQGGGDLVPVDCDEDRYTSQTPQFVLNKLRSIHRSLWVAHVNRMMRILGWKVGRGQDKGCGGTACAAFCLLGAIDKDLPHGCWDSGSLVTALCHSTSGKINLQQALTANKSLLRARKAAITQGSNNAAFKVAVAALGANATKRHRAAILKEVPDVCVSERQICAEMKRLKTSVKISAGVRPTGTDGASALLFKAASMAFESTPFRSNIVMGCIHSSCQFRAGMLRIANQLRKDLGESIPPRSQYAIDPVAADKGKGNLAHVRLVGCVLQKLLQRTGFSEEDWTKHGRSCFIRKSNVMIVLRDILQSGNAGSSCAIPDYLLQEVVDMYVPQGSQYMLLKQMDRLFAEALILSELPIFDDLTTALATGPDSNYGENDPCSECPPSERDWNLLQILRNATPQTMGVPIWPPSGLETEKVHTPTWTSERPDFAAAQVVAAITLCNRLISGSPTCVFGITWDGAKMAQASLQLNLLQSAIHISSPVLQQTLFAKQDREKAARTKRVPKKADDGNDPFSANADEQDEDDAQIYKEVRCSFAKFMSGQEHLFPLGTALVKKETPETIDTHISPHHSDLKNVGSFLTEDQPLPPGLHIHFTEPGSIAIKDGHELQAWMLSSSIGRTLSNSGKCPVVTIPMIPSVELDMKGLWEWLRTGGWSDREKLRCPWCCDKNAMQIGRSHLSVLSAMAIAPQETLLEFSDRAGMYLFDILVYNWSELRKDPVINAFLQLTQKQEKLVFQGRKRLADASTGIACFPEIEKLRSSLEAGNQWSADLRRRVEDQMGSLVLDTRPCASPIYYSAHSREAAMSNPEWKPVPGGWETIWPQEPKYSLIIFGSDEGPRQPKLLEELHLSPCAHPGCVLHCRLRIIPAFLKSLHAVILSMPSKILQQDALNNVNTYTQEANFGKQLRMGSIEEIDKTGAAANGSPSPSGRACAWAAENLEEITTRALQNWPPNQQAKKDRFIRLSRYLADVLEDLLRCDWTRRIGTCWTVTDDEDLGLDGDALDPTNADGFQIMEPLIIANLQNSFDSCKGVANVPRRFLTNLKLNRRSYALIRSESGSIIALKPSLDPVDEHEERMQLLMPKRLKHLGCLWMAAHDTYGPGAGEWDTFYMHEIIHHIGSRWNYVRGLGFSGLGVKSNSALEKMHQVYGKWSMLHAWIVMCSRQKKLSQRMGKMPTQMQEEGVDEVSESQPAEKQPVDDAILCSGLSHEELAESVLGFEPLVAQLGKRFGTLMCPTCLHPMARCKEMVAKGFPCSVLRQGEAGLYGLGVPDKGEGAQTGISDMFCQSENSAEENRIQDRALMEHLESLYSKQKINKDAEKSGRKAVIKVKPSTSRTAKPSFAEMRPRLLAAVKKIRSRHPNISPEDEPKICRPTEETSPLLEGAQVTAAGPQDNQCSCGMCGQGKACAIPAPCSGVDCERCGTTTASSPCSRSDGSAERCKVFQVLAWLHPLDEDRRNDAKREWLEAVKKITAHRGRGQGRNLVNVQPLKTWLQYFECTAPTRDTREKVPAFAERLLLALSACVDKRVATFKKPSTTTAGASSGDGGGWMGSLEEIGGGSSKEDAKSETGAAEISASMNSNSSTADCVNKGVAAFKKLRTMTAEASSGDGGPSEEIGGGSSKKDAKSEAGAAKKSASMNSHSNTADAESETGAAKKSASINSNSTLPSDESNFLTCISTQRKSEGLIISARIKENDFVRICKRLDPPPNPPSFCKGKVVETNGGMATVERFCNLEKKLERTTLPVTDLKKVNTRHVWETSLPSTALNSEDVATVWGSTNGGEAGGEWLTAAVVDASIRWTLFADTKRQGLAACAGTNFYIPNSALHELQHTVRTKLGPATGAGCTLHRLLQYLEGERAGQNWLKTNGVPMNPSTLDNLFAVFNPDIDSGSGSKARGLHYFLLQCRGDGVSVSIADAFAQETQPNHRLFLILTWAIIVASAKCPDFPLWCTTPLLTLSEEEVIGPFRSLLLDRPGDGEQDARLSAQERGQLLSMRIQTSPRTLTGDPPAETAWHWKGWHEGFPQQSNGRDCGMTVIAAAIHFARQWKIPPMNERSMNQYRWWLFSVITENSKIATPFECSHCGEQYWSTDPSCMKCEDDASKCDDRAREGDDAMCEFVSGMTEGLYPQAMTSNSERTETSGNRVGVDAHARGEHADLQQRFQPETCEICDKLTDETVKTCSKCGLPVHGKCYSSSDCAVSGWRCFQCGGHAPTDSDHQKLGGFKLVGRRDTEFGRDGADVPRRYKSKTLTLKFPELFLRGTRIGYGVFANEDIPPRTIVAEYTGEVIDNDEAKRLNAQGLATHFRALHGTGLVLDGSIRDDLGYTLEHYVDVTGDVGSLFNSYHGQVSTNNCEYSELYCDGNEKCHVVPPPRDSATPENGEGSPLQRFKFKNASVRLFLKTTRHWVRKGQQLYTHYGKKYFTTQDKTCLVPSHAPGEETAGKTRGQEVQTPGAIVLMSNNSEDMEKLGEGLDGKCSICKHVKLTGRFKDEGRCAGCAKKATEGRSGVKRGRVEAGADTQSAEGRGKARPLLKR